MWLSTYLYIVYNVMNSLSLCISMISMIVYCWCSNTLVYFFIDWLLFFNVQLQILDANAGREKIYNILKIFIAILCIFPLIFFCDNFSYHAIRWDGKLSLETKEAPGVANEIDNVVIGKIAITDYHWSSQLYCFSRFRHTGLSHLLAKDLSWIL